MGSTCLFGVTSEHPRFSPSNKPLFGRVDRQLAVGFVVPILPLVCALLFTPEFLFEPVAFGFETVVPGFSTNALFAGCVPVVFEVVEPVSEGPYLIISHSVTLRRIHSA